MSHELDLVALVPGEDDRETLLALLEQRQRSLGIRQVTHRVLKHPNRDPGCFHDAPSLLRTFVRRAERALVLFDHEGSGQEAQSPDELERDVDRRLALTGWGDRARTLVVSPELEAWMWSDSPHVATALGWDNLTALRERLTELGLWEPGAAKPTQPKLAVEQACREARLPRSSAIYRRVASKASLARCQDQNFQRLQTLLSQWFPV